MAGWSCPDRENIYWDGTINAKKYASSSTPSASVDPWVLKAGDTMTGNLTVPSLTISGLTTAGFVKNTGAGAITGGNYAKSYIFGTLASGTVAAPGSYVYLKAGEVTMTTTKCFVMPSAGEITGARMDFDVTSITGTAVSLIAEVLCNGSVFATGTASASLGTDQELTLTVTDPAAYSAGDDISMRLNCSGVKSPSVGVANVIFLVELGIK